MTSSNNDAMKASLHNLQAGRIPLIQRLNQQFLIESRFETYSNDIQKLGQKNKALIDSIDDQQTRLRVMQSMLHQPTNEEGALRRSPENVINEQGEDNVTSGNTNDTPIQIQQQQRDGSRNHAVNSLNLHDISFHHRRKRQIKLQSVSSEARDDHRRSQFFYRIASIELAIEEMETMKDGIPAQQAYLARKMQRQQQRILPLLSEIERVAHLDDSTFVSSDLLHACSQTFTKKQLVRRLQLEMTSCRNDIATYRLEMISMKNKLDSLAENIAKKREQLGDRKAALLQYDKQCNIASKVRTVISKQPEERKKYFLLLWRKEAAEQKTARNTLESISSSIRRRRLIDAWKHWTLFDSRSHQSSNYSRLKCQGGIGTNDLLLQEARLKDNIDESSAILRKFFKTDKRDEQATETYSKTNLLGDEDEAILLKGEFLFNAEHYEASLKCYERLESVISSQYLSGHFLDAIELYARVVNTIGRIHLTMQGIDLAIVYFGRGLSLAQENDMEMHRISALIGLSECYMQKHDFSYACNFLQQSLPLISSKCDKEREKIVYSLLQQCYEHLNKPEEVAFYSTKIFNMRDTHKERVEAALEKIDALSQRIVDVYASNSRVVKVQASSAKRVSLAKEMMAKERELSDTKQALRHSIEFSYQLRDLENEVAAELETAAIAKTKRIISFRIHDASQEIQKKELLFRLEEKLKMTRAQQEECLHNISSLERTIRNLNDDITDLQDEIAVEERPLIERVLEMRSYRCVAMNASNTALGNVTGGCGGVEYVALSNGRECYIHDMDSGELETVFMGDIEGQHIGHTATITALFFHGTRVYTGSMDSSLICWDVGLAAKLFQAKGHEGAVTCIFSDGTKTFSGAADKTVIIWSPDGLLLHRITGHVGGVHHIQCGLSWFASSSFGTIFVWEMILRHDSDQIVGVKCRQRLTLPQGNANVTALQFSESELVTGDNLGFLKVWDIKSAEILTSVEAHQSAVISLQVDATKVVSCGLDMIIQVTDIVQGRVLQTLRGHTAPIFAVAFDQKQIVSVSVDGEIRFWSWGRTT